MLEFRLSKVKVVSLAEKVRTLGGSSSWVVFTREKGQREKDASAKNQHVRIQQFACEIVCLPGWYFRVYPTRRPLCCNGGPHSRVRESKLGFIIFRKEGRPGTAKIHQYSQDY